MSVRLPSSPDGSPRALEDWTTSFGRGWTCGEPRCEEATLAEWAGADGKVHLDLSALAPRGTAPEEGAVALDYAELRVRYWRTGCEVESERQPAGTPDGTPCSDGLPETDGEVCMDQRCVAQ